MKNQPYLEILHYLPQSVGHGPKSLAPQKRSLKMQNLSPQPSPAESIKSPRDSHAHLSLRSDGL